MDDVDPPALDLRERDARSPNRIEQFDADVRNALAVLVGTTTFLDSRWDDLPDERRRQLVANLARRSESLQQALLPVLNRLLASSRAPSS